MNFKEKVSDLLKICIIIFGVLGIYYGSLKGGNSFVTMYYYTVLTNFVCIFTALFFLVKNSTHKMFSLDRENRLNVYTYIICVSIFIVAFTYNFIIAPYHGFSLSDYGLDNLLFHIVVPILFIVDWLLFYKKSNLSAKCVLYSAIPFAVYMVFIYSRALIFKTKIFIGTKGCASSLYPYFFMDYGNLGIVPVIKYIFILFILILISAGVLFKVGKWISE